VSWTVTRLSERQMMVGGALLAAAALVLIALNLVWYVQAVVFVLFGFGFYTLHSCIQLHVTELSSTARGAALSMHSCAFYSGQAIGPIYYGYAFAHAGTSEPLLLGAIVIIAIGLICAHLLRHPHSPQPPAAMAPRGGEDGDRAERRP
jgi:predicted MFS family arabinose efflux permease